MILSEDATYTNGRVLLRAGTELNENHIKIFKTWGIFSLNIKQNDERVTAKKQYSRDEISQAIRVTKILFQHCDLNHPLMNELFRARIKMYLDQQNEDR